MPRFISAARPRPPQGQQIKAAARRRGQARATGLRSDHGHGDARDRPEHTPLDLRIKLYCELAQYVVPRRKAVEQPIAIELPTLTSPKDAVTASAALLAAVAAGEIAPGEAREIGRLLELHLQAVEVHDFASRLAALEGKQP